MMSVAPWNELFAGEGPVVSLKLRSIQRHGRPFLLIPEQAGTATAVLSLYSAQSRRARAAKRVLNCLLSASLPFGSKPAVIQVATQAPFVRFLRSLAGVPATDLPVFGILAGNPAEEGQRLLLLIFESSRRPAAVVKVGITPRAQALVLKEQTFLESLAPAVKGTPKLRSCFATPGWRALALNYFPGDSPTGAWDEEALIAILGSWVAAEQNSSITDTPLWSRLQPLLSSNQQWARALEPLAGRVIRSAIHHGDLAPWNIKVAGDGTWTVLDWERGELRGIPAWDWFHYALQPAILVQRRPTAQLIETLEKLLSSAAFQSYSTRINTCGLERPLVLSYLIYMLEVIKPAQGSAEMRQLLQALLERWQNG